MHLCSNVLITQLEHLRDFLINIKLKAPLPKIDIYIEPCPDDGFFVRYIGTRMQIFFFNI